MSKIVSVDIETTGLNPSRDKIIEFGAVIFDPNDHQQRWQFFDRLVDPGVIVGEPYALAMNADIIAEIAGQKRPKSEIVSPSLLVSRFLLWLKENGLATKDGEKITVTGKNYAGFDGPFLSAVNNWKNLIPVHHRVLDPGSLLYVPAEDEHLPSLQECLRRVGIRKEPAHRALDDAIDVATVISRFFS